ncbi:MAG TPA: metal ABC transporter ATP-binding protein [Dehalococcoidia bacterium]|nr:metal ABC transporter ATP-binding protein [Dehalococcoidia bacterium]
MLHPLPHQPESGEAIIQFRGVNCGYGSEIVLSGVNLQLMPGDFVGILGPSGSGKTTILRAILGAVDVYAGEIRVEGHKVGTHRPSVGYVPQLETVDWTFPITVEQVVLLGRAGNGWLPWPRREDREKAQEIMERLGILHLAKRHIRELSGGQQQRAFLARALVRNPRILLLDEPTTGVDIKTRDEVLHLLDDLNHQGITVVMTTHELNAVAAHLPWVVCVNRRIIAEGPPHEVYNPQILRETYGAEMEVIRHNGLTLVAETPHRLGEHHRHRAGRRESLKEEAVDV